MLSRDALLAEHGPMVQELARRVRADLGLDVELADLVSEGYTGLFEAADRFDPTLGKPFGAFAHRRVRGAMVDGVRRMARVSRRAHEQCERLAAVYQALDENAVHTANEGEHAPDRQAVAGALEALAAQMATAFALRLSAQHEGREDPEQALMTAEDHATIRSGIGELTDKQQGVLIGLFYKGKTQEQLARELKMTRAGVAKACSRGLLALRDKFK